MNRTKTAPKIRQRAGKPLFVTRGERALKRAARKVRADHKRLGLRLMVWPQAASKKAKP